MHWVRGKFCFVFKMCNIKACLYANYKEQVQRENLEMLERKCAMVGTESLGDKTEVKVF